MEGRLLYYHSQWDKGKHKNARCFLVHLQASHGRNDCLVGQVPSRLFIISKAVDE